ncbi:hypothetical protein Agub_g12385, partial [Astrephomene gubernaculifera]
SPLGAVASPSARRSPLPSGLQAATCTTPCFGAGTPRQHFGALARLEEVQLQLVQAEEARQELQSELQAAQAVLKSKDSELITVKVLLTEYERMHAAATPPRSHWPVPRRVGAILASAGDTAAVNDVSLHVRGSPVRDLGRVKAKLFDDTESCVMASKLEKLQAECQELACRAAELDKQRKRAVKEAEHRKAELRAAQEYIRELEEEVSLLREAKNSTSQEVPLQEAIPDAANAEAEGSAPDEMQDAWQIALMDGQHVGQDDLRQQPLAVEAATSTVVMGGYHGQAAAAAPALLELTTATAQAACQALMGQPTPESAALQAQAAEVKYQDEQASRAAGHAAELQRQVHAARAELAEKARRFAADLEEREQRLSSARAEVAEQARRYNTLAVDYEAQLKAARSEAAEQAERLSSQVWDLEAQLGAANSDLVDQARMYIGL